MQGFAQKIDDGQIARQLVATMEWPAPMNSQQESLRRHFEHCEMKRQEWDCSSGRSDEEALETVRGGGCGAKEEREDMPGLLIDFAVLRLKTLTMEQFAALALDVSNRADVCYWQLEQAALKARYLALFQKLAETKPRPGAIAGVKDAAGCGCHGRIHSHPRTN
jgi:hypothetical protein